MADLSFWHQYKKAFAAQPNKKGTPDHYYSGQFSDPPPACYEPGHTCHLFQFPFAAICNSEPASVLQQSHGSRTEA